MGSTSFGRQDIKFNDLADYPLTTSYVASDTVTVQAQDSNLKFVKKFSVYLYYTPGAGGTGNSIQYQVEINPFYYSEDKTNLFWAPIGKYVDVAGTWTEEPASFVSLTGTTAATKYALVPLDIIDPSAARVRIKVKETIVGGVAGSVRIMLGTNTIN